VQVLAQEEEEQEQPQAQEEVEAQVQVSPQEEVVVEWEAALVVEGVEEEAEV
jgi:hypothetical protein